VRLLGECPACTSTRDGLQRSEPHMSTSPVSSFDVQPLTIDLQENKVPHVPRYCRHKTKGLAYVRLDGQFIYLGPYGSSGQQG
jgi:hypothetical protein